MDNSEARKLYFSKIDPNSSDGELVASKCATCEGCGCEKCNYTGKVPFKFEVSGVWYSVPLWLYVNKEGVHELMKAISPDFPVDADSGKPKSLGKGKNSASDDEIYKLLDWMFVAGIESGIDLTDWEEQRRRDG